MFAKKAGWALAIVLGVGATGCMGTPEEDTAEGSQDAIRLETQAVVRGMMGLDYEPPTDPTPEEARLEGAGRIILAELGRIDPGALDRFDAALAPHDEGSIEAWKNMRERLEEIAASERVQRTIREQRLHEGVAPDGTAPLESGSEEPAAQDEGGLEEAESAGGEGGIGSKSIGIRTRGGDDVPNIGRGPDGLYGDDRQGVGGALRDGRDFFVFGTLSKLRKIDRGEVRPDPESRLGAYAATRGYPRGTVGFAVHRAIGAIFVTLGNLGEEKIGRVFASAQARQLYNQPVTSGAGYRMAQIEHRYWLNVYNEDRWSPGGKLGSTFSPAARYAIQIAVSAP